MTLKSEFLHILETRGFFNQATDLESLDTHMSQGPVTAYIGFDATASSFHVGNLVSLMLLRWLQNTGHKPIFLLGGGTTRVGDPSGKDSARQLLSAEDILNNMNSIRSGLTRLIDFSKAQMVDNADWLLKLNYIDFLRDFGRHFSINRMLTFDSVKLRLDREQSLSFLEFNYMILQAYDFYHLYKEMGCTLQMGGSDQWGNIVNGVELVRKVLQKPCFGLTTHLITNSDGSKMGKSVNGAIWINADRLSPYDYWQFWRNTQDADVGRYLKLFTELPLDEIQRLESLRDSEINEAKKILADAATTLIHGPDVLTSIHQTVTQLFEQGQGNLESLPTIQLSSLSLIDALVQTGLSDSKGDARRLIRGGGAKLNDQPVQDETYSLQPQDFIHDGLAKLTAGKKRNALVKA